MNLNRYNNKMGYNITYQEYFGFYYVMCLISLLDNKYLHHKFEKMRNSNSAYLLAYNLRWNASLQLHLEFQ